MGAIEKNLLLGPAERRLMVLRKATKIQIRHIKIRTIIHRLHQRQRPKESGLSSWNGTCQVRLTSPTIVTVLSLELDQITSYS